MNDFTLCLRKKYPCLEAGMCNGAMCDYRCFYAFVCARARVPPPKAAGASALVIFPVV